MVEPANPIPTEGSDEANVSPDEVMDNFQINKVSQAQEYNLINGVNFRETAVIEAVKGRKTRTVVCRKDKEEPERYENTPREWE